MTEWKPLYDRKFYRERQWVFGHENISTLEFDDKETNYNIVDYYNKMEEKYPDNYLAVSKTYSNATKAVTLYRKTDLPKDRGEDEYDNYR